MKTIDLLSTFSAWELRGFAEMLGSPSTNKNEMLIPLYAYLRESLAEGEENDLESISAHLFPGEPFDHQRIRYLLTDLNRLVEEYLVQKELQDQPILKELLLMDAYRARHLGRYQKRVLEKVRQKEAKNKLRDSESHYREFRLLEAELGGGNLSDHGHQTETLRKTLESLEKFHLSTRLKYMCELVNRQNVVSVDFELHPAWALLAELDRSPYQDLPAIAIYHRILRTLLDSEQASHYHDLRSLLRVHFQAFSPEELGQMYAFALNYCIKKLNSGQTDYLRELFGLYQELLEGRILHVGGHLPPGHFKNIVTTAIRLEEFDWAEAIIRDFAQDLPADARENARIYNAAALAFAQGDYSSSLRMLQQVEFTDVFYQLDSNALLLKAYYELGDFEPLLSLVEAFKLYLKRNKILSEYQRRVYLNLVKFVKSLVRIRLGSRKTIDQLRLEVQATPEVADLRWLLGKMGEM